MRVVEGLGLGVSRCEVLEHIHGIEFFPEKLGRCLRDPVSNVVQSAVPWFSWDGLGFRA